MKRLLLLLVVLLLPRAALAAEPPRPMRRIAVIVGSNEAAPGRQALRYAHNDAQLIADVFERVGRFARSDVHVLLEPHPADVLAALDRASQEIQQANAESLLVFYYSGHSDGQLVFPHGEPLQLSDLRDRIAKSSARIRVAILDTCHGGGWTRTKGLSVGPALDVADLMSVSPEGTVLLSSSSGLENAHEAATVKGSFFTHHVAAGLLGAADKSGDGNVTLQEVFEYAKERTVRDSARMATSTQHPSFDTQLRGRQDIVLAQISASSSSLDLTQKNTLEVIHLASGVTVVETPQGSQKLRLALVPGRYLVRRVMADRVYSKEIDVRPGTTVAVDEAQLEATGNERLAIKDAAPVEPSYSEHSTMKKKWWEIRVGLGVSTGPRAFGPGLYGTQQRDGLTRDFAGVGSSTYGITDRLSWSAPVPAFAYRFGEEGSFEVIPRAGMTSVGYAVNSGFLGSVDAGAATRTWLTQNLSLISNTSVSWSFVGKTPMFASPNERLRLHASTGVMWNIKDRVTIALGAGVHGDAALSGEGLPTTPPSLIFGSVQTLGYRPLPLIQVHLTRSFSLDAYASIGIDLRDGTGLRDRYLGGFTVAF